MVKIFKNIILMLMLFAVILMMIGIVFYDYLPTRTEIKEPNEYKAEEKVIKTLATIEKEEKEIFGVKEDSDGTSVGTIIQSYSLDAEDLAVYQQSHSYVSGKTNPFEDLPEIVEPGAEGTTGSNNNSGTSSNNNSNNNNNNNSNTNTSGNTNTNNINTNTLNEVKDNTLLNSGSSK